MFYLRLCNLRTFDSVINSVPPNITIIRSGSIIALSYAGYII